MALTVEEEKAADYCKQPKQREEFQNYLAKRLEGSEYRRRQLCIKTKPVIPGPSGDTSNDH